MYVIRDFEKHGYAVKDPIEGWIFTILASAATMFSTEVEASAIIGMYYGSMKPKPVVEKV